jgi:hypothetical protein
MEGRQGIRRALAKVRRLPRRHSIRKKEAAFPAASLLDKQRLKN